MRLVLAVSNTPYSRGMNGATEPVGVYGLGRFGTFWARMLARSTSVVATTRSGPRDVGGGVRFGSLEEVCAQPNLFLCVSISSMDEALRRIAPLIGRDTCVFDTCSVKVTPSQQMLELLPAHAQIVATHPMFGPDSAGERADPLPIITYPLRVDSQRYAWWVRFFQAIGLRVEQMTPEAHDREAAFTQGVTHLVGRLLAEMQLQPSAIATLGYRRLLQVMEQTCNDPLQLFVDLQRSNPFTREMRERFREALVAVESLLSDGDDASRLD